MKYNDIIEIRQGLAAYNIEEESLGDWKTFIANDKFNDVLKCMVSAVRNNDADNHKSLWISGTYGSGKSHAGAVLKHLFCDPLDDILEYINDEYKDDKHSLLRNSLINVRQQKRLLPVLQHSTRNIAHEDDLSLALQKSIKKALADAKIDIVVQTDFDTLANHVDEQPAIWQSLINNNPILRSSAPDLNILKTRLKEADPSTLHDIKDAQRTANIDIRIKGNNIKRWILEVQDKLHDYGYSGLLIIWDEFTELMTSAYGTRVLVQIQEIAEAMSAPQNDSYFLLISHPSALNTLKEEEREKTKGRYHYMIYNMEPASAFKIMTKKFRIINGDLYQRLKDQFFSLHPELPDTFASTSASLDETINDIKNLFPLHPSTANLATYYAREAGSSNRSVFSFLAQDTIKEFLDDEENYVNGRTITCDLLYDYVKEHFEGDTARFGAVTERYNSHHLAVENAGANHLRVFKGILLLNALNNIANSDSVTPSYVNIRNLFVGTDVEPELDTILDFLNDKSIIQRQPNGNFSILFTALPGNEIQTIKEELKGSNFRYTDQVIKFGSEARTNLSTIFSQVFRPKVYEFFAQQGNEYTLLNQIENAQRKAQPYELFIAVLVARTQEELLSLKDIAARQSGEERVANVIFLVMETMFGEKEYERFIEYQANAECAQRHGLTEQQKTYAKNATEMLSQWTTRMKSGPVTVYIRRLNMPSIYGSKIANAINTTISRIIFSNGPESLELIRLQTAATYWNKSAVKAIVETVLGFNNKNDVFDRVKGPYMHLKYLLQDSVDDELNLKPDIDPNHPLKKVCDFIDKKLKSVPKDQAFNLGEKLKALTEPPYGLYQGCASMAMVAFAMRKYADHIFDTNGKQLTSKHLVDVIVEMFKGWENRNGTNSKYMFESTEARNLCKALTDMFSLKTLKDYSNISSLRDAAFAVKSYLNEVKFPLWSLKYCSSDYNTPDMRQLVDDIQKLIIDYEDSVKNPQLVTRAIGGYKKQSIEWGNLLIQNNRGNYEEGFTNYLKGVKDVRLQDDEYPDALQFLRGHLEGDPAFWKESAVAYQLMAWRMSRNSPIITVAEPTTDGETSTESYTSTKQSNEEVAQKRVKLANKLKMIPPDEVKEIINEIIKKEDAIVNILVKYVL